MDFQETLKKCSKIALAFMAVLFILGAIFYKERVLFSDAAFRVFNMINYSRFDVPGNRYGAFVVQVLPYLALKLHWSVNVILFFYGFSYYLFYLLVMVLLVYGYRQYSFAILMALYYFLFVSESYMWVSETFEGIAWMFLFFAVALHLGNKRVNTFLLLFPFSLLAFLTIFTHFVIIIPVTFLWIYFIIEKKNWPFSKNISILLSCALVFITALKFIDTSTHPYDSDHLHGVTHFSLQDIINTFTTPVFGMFLYRCITNYWITVIVFIISMVSLIKYKQKALAAWTFIAALGYFIIMGLTYGDLDNKVQLFHIESEWSCISIIVAAGFVFTFLPRLKPLTAGCFLVGIFIIRLIYICIGISSFVLRTHLNEQVLAQMRKKGITKLALFIDDRQFLSINKLHWGLPFESLMMSAVNGDKPQLTFCSLNRDDKQSIQEIADPKKVYISFGMMKVNEFNKKYFLVDSTHPYQVMTYEEFMK